MRRGIQHTVDRESAMEATTGGRGLVTYTITSPQSPKFAALDEASFRRPFDLRAAQQWFEEAGMTRGSNGMYFGPDGQPARLEVAAEAGPISQRDNAILVDGLRQAGIDAFPNLFPLAQARDNQFRALRPGLAQSSLPGRALSKFISAEVPRPENRWGGDVRGGWTNPEYDRLWQAYDTSLDAAERLRTIGQMERLIADDVVGFPTYFTVLLNAYSSAVKGVNIRMLPDAGFGLHRVDTWEWSAS
jgi:ABC-type transport system substrate-binding protein